RCRPSASRSRPPTRPSTRPASRASSCCARPESVGVARSVLAVGARLAAGIGASLLAGRLRLPGLVLVLALGMAIGSDGLGWIDFGDFRAAQSAAGVRLPLIL